MNDNFIKVAVIMSTYNGEKYLREQIDSILDQKNVDVELFIRDDGSNDSTAEIINEYADKNNNVIFWNKDNIINLGIRDSFLTLLKEVCDEYTDINYFAFADQDDVWKPEKLDAAVKMIEENADRETPALYYSNKTIVDANLNIISEEHIKYYGDFFEALWPSLASGCTMVFNKKMAEMAVRHLPIQYSSIHDAWVYRLAKCSDAKIIFDETSHIYYRQHAKNVCGIEASKLVNNHSFFHMFNKYKLFYSSQIAYIHNLDAEYTGKNSKKYIEMVVNYNKSFKDTMKMIFSKMAMKRGLPLYLTWAVKVILRKI